jgi:hypothetical protein
MTTDDETYAVEATPDGDYSFSIDFPETLAWEEEERIDKLAERLDARPDVEQAFREDREFILVDAPGIASAAFEAIVAEAWEQAAVGSKYQRFNAAGELEDAERAP